jgi:16S rRNA (cytosine1402-N4)-methyltransferase
LNENGKLIAFDQDQDAIANKINDTRFILIRENFRNMEEHLRNQGYTTVNGILADLGVSSHQFDKAERGFSIRFDHNLDMRMDDRLPQTALHILNTYPVKDLVSVFSQYGEVKNSKTLAAKIAEIRNRKLFTGSEDFRSAIEHLAPKQNESTWYAQIYQALRIEVNDELAALKQLLQQSGSVLEKDGRLVVMSYHSLEDRLVKNYIAKGNFEGTDQKDLFGNAINRPFKPLTKKPVTPSDEEVKSNPRSRSAKLRIGVKN